jgi:hypothetical protein
MNKPFPKRHDDDDYVDEIRVVIRERYKTSGLSGDEWRFHRVVQLYRKGALLGERPFNGSMQTVAGFVGLAYAEICEGGEFTRPADEHLCFQPGCRNEAVSEYELIEEFGPQGQRLHPDESMTARWSVRRKFCARHLRRGDCGREDSDRNYRVVSGPGPDNTDWSDANVTESAQMVVQVPDLEHLPDAIDSALKARNADAN